jgi:hypothetical protein
MSVPAMAVSFVNCIPASCMPSPESPANRITTSSRSSWRLGAFGVGGVSIRAVLVPSSLMIPLFLSRVSRHISPVYRRPDQVRHPLHDGVGVKDASTGRRTKNLRTESNREAAVPIISMAQQASAKVADRPQGRTTGPVQHLLERREEKPVLDFLFYGLVPLIPITQLNLHWRFPCLRMAVGVKGPTPGTTVRSRRSLWHSGS